jgi:hypothetical protein
MKVAKTWSNNTHLQNNGGERSLISWENIVRSQAASSEWYTLETLYGGIMFHPKNDRKDDGDDIANI